MPGIRGKNQIVELVNLTVGHLSEGKATIEKEPSLEPFDEPGTFLVTPKLSGSIFLYWKTGSVSISGITFKVQRRRKPGTRIKRWTIVITDLVQTSPPIAIDIQLVIDRLNLAISSYLAAETPA